MAAKKRPEKIVFLFFVMAGLLIFFPFASTRFHYDDFFWISILEENVPYNPWFGFWNADVERAHIFSGIWWNETNNPGDFFRPIFSAVFALFFKLFKRNAALPLHLFSILLHAANGFLTFALFRRLSGKYFLALTAGFLFLICEDTALSVGWISTATDLICVFFINISLIFWFEGRTSGKSILTALSCIFLLCALASKESAIAAPAFIILYEFVFAGSQEEKNPLMQRMRLFLAAYKSWLPALIIFFGYLVFFKAAGFGTQNLAYYDPLKEPLRYLNSLAVNLPMMYAGLLSSAPLGIALFVPQAVFPLALAGILLLALFTAALWPSRKDPLVQFCYLFFIVALAPQLSTEATERQLYFPLVTGVFLLAVVIFQMPSLREKFLPESPEPLPYLGRGMAVYLMITAVVFALILSPAYAFSYGGSLQAPEDAVLKAKSLQEKYRAGTIIHLNAPGPFLSLYASSIYRYHSFTGRVKILSSFSGRMFIRQNSENSFSLKTDGPGWLSNMFAMIVRVRPLFEKGQVYQTEIFRVTIEEITPDAKDILQARFDFPKSLKDPDLLFVRYEKGNMDRWEFDRPSSEWRLLGDSSNIMDSL